VSQAFYKITITERDYHYTEYSAWVAASSKTQAVAKAAALAGQEKARREFERTGRADALCPEGLLEPEVKLAVVSVDEYYEHREEVTVRGI
jgi:hypothetical protein